PSADRYFPRERAHVQTWNFFTTVCRETRADVRQNGRGRSSRGSRHLRETNSARWRSERARAPNGARERAPGELMRPGFPAFADRLGVTVDVDFPQAIDTSFDGLSRVFVLLFQ